MDMPAGFGLASREPDIGIDEKCLLLHWDGRGQVVARGQVGGKHPDQVVNNKILGPRSWKVWVDAVFVNDVQLYRDGGTLDTNFIDGQPVVWPHEFIQPDHQ